MARKPCAVTISSTEAPASDIVKLIVTDEEFHRPEELEHGITAYPWHINTKYYTADVHVCALNERTIGCEAFADSVQAIIISFNSNKNNGLVAVEQWEQTYDTFDAEVKILLCEKCEENPTTGVSKLVAQEWCIARGFELVEINPDVDEEWEREQDFLETTGVPRIIQALHAHVWPDLSMKGHSGTNSQSVQSMLLNLSAASTMANSIAMGDDGDGDLSKDLQSLRLCEEVLNRNSPNDTQSLDDEPPDPLGSGGTTDDFFELFQNLAEMKQRVSGMASDERKACAEQVVKAFWEVIGGNRDELSDLSDDENKYHELNDNEDK